MDQNRSSSIQACLIGGAIGDALGSALEFLALRDIRELYGDAGVQTLINPEFTDDTQLSLFTLEGLIRAGLKQIQDRVGLLTQLHQSYLRWLHTQGEKIDPSLRSGWLLNEEILFEQKAPGLTCLKSLGSGRMGLKEGPINQSKGCGGLMRVAPVGLYFYQDPEKAFAVGADSAALTHGHPTGYLAAAYFAAVIALMLQPLPLEQAVQEALPLLKKESDHVECLQQIERALDMHAGGMRPTPELLEKMGDKWPGVLAEEALGMSLFCALSYPHDYRWGCLAAINHSGDSDVVGLLTGQLLALNNGITNIPEEWRQKVKGMKMIEQLAVDLRAVMQDNVSDDLLKRYQ